MKNRLTGARTLSPRYGYVILALMCLGIAMPSFAQYQISGFGMGENEMTVDDIHAKQARMVQVAKGLGFAFPRASCLTAAGASPSWADGETAAGPPAAGDASSVSASALTSSLSDIYSSSGLIPAILRMITKARGESPKAPSSAPCE